MRGRSCWCHLFFSKRPKCGPCQPCARKHIAHGVNNNTLQPRQNLYNVPLNMYTLRIVVGLKFGILSAIIF